MRKHLSSHATGFYKFVLPVCPVCFVCFSIYLVFVRDVEFYGPAGSSTPVWFRWLVLVVGLLICYGWWRSLRPLRRVTLDDESLLVSNYVREIRVPLKNLSSVRERRTTVGREITLNLREPTEMGTTIVFVAGSVRWLWPWQEHPTLRDLRSLISPATASDERAPQSRLGLS